jgi:hypothetical protein
MDDLFGYYHVHLQDELDFDAKHTSTLDDHWFAQHEHDTDEYFDGND